jgi:hypothetical protein
MYSNKIDTYSFEYDSESSKILVYEEGKGLDPVHLIAVKPNLTEKEFHYEIMDFVAKRG